jgi:hypothetical protein
MLEPYLNDGTEPKGPFLPAVALFSALVVFAVAGGVEGWHKVDTPPLPPVGVHGNLPAKLGGIPIVPFSRHTGVVPERRGDWGAKTPSW